MPNFVGYFLLIVILGLLYWSVTPTVKIRRDHSAPVVLPLLFGSYLVLSSFWALAFHTAFATSILTLVTILIGIAALNRPYFLKILPKVVLIGSLIQAFGVILPMISPGLYLAILSHIPGETQYLARGFLFGGRSSGFTPQTAYVGFYTTIGIAVIFCKLAFRRHRVSVKIIYYALLIFEYIALIFTFKRSGMVVAIVVPVIILFINRRISAMNVLKYGSLVFVLTTVAIVYLSDVPEFEASIDRFTMEDDKKHDITSGRGELANKAIDLFKADPILGIGYGCYGLLSDKGTHNVYLEVLCEGGLIGLILYVPWLLSNMWAVVKAVRRRSGNLYLLNFSLFIQLYYLIYSAVGNCLTDNFIFLLYVLMAALPYAIETKNVDHDQPGLHPLLAA